MLLLERDVTKARPSSAKSISYIESKNSTERGTDLKEKFTEKLDLSSKAISVANFNVEVGYLFGK
jgi:hypothetical protein